MDGKVCRSQAMDLVKSRPIAFSMVYLLGGWTAYLAQAGCMLLIYEVGGYFAYLRYEYRVPGMLLLSLINVILFSLTILLNNTIMSHMNGFICKLSDSEFSGERVGLFGLFGLLRFFIPNLGSLKSGIALMVIQSPIIVVAELLSLCIIVPSIPGRTGTSIGVDAVTSLMAVAYAMLKYTPVIMYPFVTRYIAYLGFDNPSLSVRDILRLNFKMLSGRRIQVFGFVLMCSIKLTLSLFALYIPIVVLIILFPSAMFSLPLLLIFAVFAFVLFAPLTLFFNTKFLVSLAVEYINLRDYLSYIGKNHSENQCKVSDCHFDPIVEAVNDNSTD